MAHPNVVVFDVRAGPTAARSLGFFLKLVVENAWEPTVECVRVRTSCLEFQVRNVLKSSPGGASHLSPAPERWEKSEE